MKKESIYTIGYESNFVRQEDFDAFLDLHAVSNSLYALIRDSGGSTGRYEFVNNSLSHMDPWPRRLESFEEQYSWLKYHKCSPNELSFFHVSDSPTNSYVGGRPKDDFRFPRGQSDIYKMHFVALIDAYEMGLDWLPFDSFHVIYPLYVSVFGILFLDYSDHLKPTVINAEVGTDKLFDFSGHDARTHIYDQVFLNRYRVNSNTTPDEFKIANKTRWGNSGAPIWVQAPLYPKCPISGSPMKFAFSISTEDGDFDQPSLMNSQIVSQDRGFDEYKETLSVCLYVFVEPNQRTVAVVSQGT